MAKPRILVIDDLLLNTRLLERKLERSDMEVHSATNGPDGLELARRIRPDVILLDIVMPGMDGIEVCRELKRDPLLREIPVIFITARTGKEDKLEGFDVGAADYLVKPIDLDESLARIKTQLRIIQEHADNLRLTRQLEESRRQSSIMHLTEGIAHNLNNLMGVISGYISLVKMNPGQMDKVVAHCGRIEGALQRMTRIVHQLSVIGHFKSLQKQDVPLQRVLQGAVARFHRSAGTDFPVWQDLQVPDGFSFATNRELLEAALERILQNAWESHPAGDDGKPAPGAEVVLQATLVGNQDSGRRLELRVLDRGRGIDPQIKDSIFEPFVTSSATVGRGMGLTIARHSISCLGGTIEVTGREGGGTQAVVLLPLEAATGGEA